MIIKLPHHSGGRRQAVSIQAIQDYIDAMAESERDARAAMAVARRCLATAERGDFCAAAELASSISEIERQHQYGPDWGESLQAVVLASRPSFRDWLDTQPQIDVLPASARFMLDVLVPVHLLTDPGQDPDRDANIWAEFEALITPMRDMEQK